MAIMDHHHHHHHGHHGSSSSSSSWSLVIIIIIKIIVSNIFAITQVVCRTTYFSSFTLSCVHAVRTMVFKTCVQRQGTLPSPPPQPKTPIIAVASTTRATPRNVTITPTPTQDTHHCRSIDHACNAKGRYHHPHPNPRHTSLP